MPSLRYSAFGSPPALTNGKTARESIALPLVPRQTGSSIKFFILASAIQAGAGDYIFKGSLNRLIPAVEHYLREANIRREHRQMLLDLKENQTRLQALISNLPGMAYQLLLTHSGEASFPYISEGCYALLGVHPQDLERDHQ